MSTLEQRALGDTGIEVSALGFGALSIGRDWGLADTGRPDEAEAVAVVHGALDSGITLIDTAAAYHRSEERIGLALDGSGRTAVVATKCGEHSREPDTFYDFSHAAIRDSITASLRALRTDRLDVLQIHFGPDQDRVLDDGGCLRAMREARDAGLVGALGASVDGPVLDRCIADGSFGVVEVRCSLLDQSQLDRIAAAAERGIGVLIRTGLAGGWLTGRALDLPVEARPQGLTEIIDLCGGDPTLLTSVALRFLTRNPAVSSVLIGTKSLDRLRQAIACHTAEVDDALVTEAARIAAGA
jgi:aryl-alcohol dehydrogenase-like predicted oxidoreductase